jgi:hypothetical protein
MNLRQQHPSLDDLSQYCAGTLDEFEQMALEDHFGVCEDCLEATERMNALLYGGMNSASHAAQARAEAIAADPLAKALRRAAGLSHEYRELLHQWLESAAASWGELTAPRLGHVAAVFTSSGAEPFLVVALEAETDRAEIRIEVPVEVLEIRTTKPARLAVLFPAGDRSGEVMTAAFTVEGSVGIARFPNVAEGDYLLALSPDR